MPAGLSAMKDMNSGFISLFCGRPVMGAPSLQSLFCYRTKETFYLKVSGRNKNYSGQEGQTKERGENYDPSNHEERV